MLDRRQGLRAAIAAAGLAAAPGLTRAESARAAPLVVPLSEQRNRYLVEVEINGVGGFRFVLDTGSSTHYVSTRVVELLALPQVDRRMGRSVGGREREEVVAFESFTVGGVPLGAVRADAWPPERLEGHDGLIGYPFLFPSAVLNLGMGEVSLGGDAPATMTPVQALVSRDQTLLLGGVPGVQGRFVFDTGAQAWTVTPAYVRRIAATDAWQTAQKLVARNAEGETEIVAFRPDEMRFGAFRIERPAIRVAPPGGAVGSLFDQVDGLFGVSLIKPYAWALDQVGRSLRAGPLPT